MSIEYGGWLELLLLTVPVAAFLTVRRIVKGQKFGLEDIAAGVFFSYIWLMMMLLAAAVLYGAATFVVAPIVIAWGFLSGDEPKALMKTPETRMFFVVVWLVLVVLAIRWYRKPDDRKEDAGND